MRRFLYPVGLLALCLALLCGIAQQFDAGTALLFAGLGLCVLADMAPRRRAGE